ncbi:tyrosine-type recombinase/integrase [Segetibacter koreensis]|uniref:tyrosine-type recombinase/integrase n=1 Tax=Segetibacter koreensis TaxID=398037 RepID=UPI0003669C32|nr:tyrosine-type recombinase/integrase [Segetibacter koreensis]
MELEAIDYNPVREVSKKNGVKLLRNVLTLEERAVIDNYLREHDKAFWVFTHIFFQSGARLTELMKVRLDDVNIAKQTFKVIVIKGRSKKEVLKPIKNVALPFWIEAIKNAAPGQYIFSEGLIPGDEPIRTDQVTKRWSRHIKKKLKIKGDFYSLKHSNLDETAALLSLADASAMASHTSVNVTRKFYAVGEQERQNERLKNLDNTLS